MGKVVGDVLGLAAGVAISPLPIIAIILILATPRGRLNGPLFTIGWILGLSPETLISTPLPDINSCASSF